MIYVDTEVMPSLLLNLSEELLLQLLGLYEGKIVEDERYISSFEKFLQSIVDSEAVVGKLCLTTDQFKLIFERLGKSTAKQLLDEEPADFLHVQMLTSVLR